MHLDFSFLAEAFAPFAKIMVILLAVVFFGILVDYLTGTIAAKINDEWSSKIAREGIMHKVGILLAILVAIILDLAVLAAKDTLGWTFAYFGLFTPLVTLAYIVTEIGSILENLKHMGVYVPPILIKGFKLLSHAVDEHTEDVPDPEEPESEDGKEEE